MLPEGSTSGAVGITGTVLAGHHQPLRVWGPCPCFMGLDLSNRQVASEPDLGPSDVQAMTERLRDGLVARAPEGVLNGEIDDVHGVAGHKGRPEEVARSRGWAGAAGWQGISQDKLPGYPRRRPTVVQELPLLLEAVTRELAARHPDGPSEQDERRR